MKLQRFQLALEHLQPTQWKRFEELASELLAAEFANLRTMASPEGDRGPDAELANPADDPRTDVTTVQHLAAHDVENYLGIIERRRAERDSPFGYNSWWLTLDLRAPVSLL